ncbi:MAG: FxsA family protein [Gammaproteobacteria bacterium]
MRPFPVIAAALIGIPLLEIYLFIKVGGAIGALPTIALTVLTAVTGALLVRAQGLATLRRAQASLRRDELPALELLEAAALLVGGLLLLIPGFFTDAMGLMLLLPACRKALLGRLLPRMRIIALSSRPAGITETSRVIEGEYTRKPDE